MKYIPDRISNLAGSVLDRTGTLGLPCPSPTILLLSLILGPALLMALHTVHVPTVFANIGTPATCQSCHWLSQDPPPPQIGETAQIGSGAATSQVQVADDLNQHEYISAGQCTMTIRALAWQHSAETTSAIYRDQARQAGEDVCRLGAICNWWRAHP